MLKVVAQQFIRPEALAAVEPLFQRLMEESRKEPGCLSYRLYTNVSDEAHIIIVEEWQDVEVLENHRQTNHFKTLIPQIREHASRPPEAIIMKEWC